MWKIAKFQNKNADVSKLTNLGETKGVCFQKILDQGLVTPSIKRFLWNFLRSPETPNRPNRVLKKWAIFFKPYFLNCVKYFRIRVFSCPHFPLEGNDYRYLVSVFTRENTG